MQGRSIMLFTVMTIIFVSGRPKGNIPLYDELASFWPGDATESKPFSEETSFSTAVSTSDHGLTAVAPPQLPLSFMTSLFGMNAVEFTAKANDPLLPWQIRNFWPLAFKQQVLIMCTSSTAPRPP